jgi:hypothetical protein
MLSPEFMNRVRAADHERARHRGLTIVKAVAVDLEHVVGLAGRRAPEISDFLYPLPSRLREALRLLSRGDMQQ